MDYESLTQSAVSKLVVLTRTSIIDRHSVLLLILLVLLLLSLRRPHSSSLVSSRRSKQPRACHYLSVTPSTVSLRAVSAVDTSTRYKHSIDHGFQPFSSRPLPTQLTY